MKLSSVYEPQTYEADIYALWEKSGAFQPTKTGTPYSVVVPPPNANASMHIGTAMTLGLEDIAVRYHRLKGYRTLFLPGADHAGFETQAVFEKHLAKEGKSRFDFTREELYKNIWDFVAQNRKGFETQFRQLGASVDWTRFTFTLDDHIVQRAYATFKKLWDDGLVYRSERLVNYCTFHQTGFADVEVVYKEAKTPLYYMKYGPFTLATTRPETKFGDTAVAVHPDDKRYKKYVGKVIEVQGVNGPFSVQVIADEMVDPNFGTGVVKITPAHSFDDWEVAQRHSLPVKRVINHDGTLNHETGKYEGMTVPEARKAVVKALEEQGLLVKTDHDYCNRVGHCYKCDTVIEPMLMEQWFINMQPLAEAAITVLETGKITFHPETKKQQLITYLQGLRDWNISRQIAWGIPIPAFQNVDDRDDWIFNTEVDQEIIKVDGKTYRRDPDVFDTWFSSSSWPYATLRYGDPKSTDFDDFYPLSLMETGGEILYPWVSRMIMLGLYVTGKIPFTTVYIHGYVMAEDGSKMSKSLGNVVNAPEVIEQYGADALRMGIIAGRVPAVNRGYDRRKIEDARNFCNKLWNIARYIEGKSGSKTQDDPVTPRADADHWIVHKLQQNSELISSHLDNYRFAEAYDALYHFVWDDFADWYIEASKAGENVPLLNTCLKAILVLTHPFAPFVTETIWQTLGDTKQPILATAAWPQAPVFDKTRAKTFEEVRAIITETRALLKNLKTPGVPLLYTGAPVIDANARLIQRLSGAGTATKLDQPATQGIKLIQTRYNVWLDIPAEAVTTYSTTLKERLAAEEQATQRLQDRLANKSYVANAPKAVVAQTEAQLAEAQTRLAAIKDEITRFAS